MELRPYQKTALDQTRDAIKRGKRRIMVVMPTGSGKSWVMRKIAKGALLKGNKILSLVHMRNLVTQLHDHYIDEGLDSAIIMAGHESDTDQPCQVASVYTMNRRLKLEELCYNRFFINANVILIDEGHHALSKTFQNILSNYEDKIVIAFTATPALSSNVGMGNYFDELICPVSVSELIKDGFLVPGEYYGFDPPDLSSVPVTGGDYQKTSLSSIMNDKKLIGDALYNWTKLANENLTMVFCVTNSHARAVCREYRDKGIAVEQLDAHHSDDERDAVLERFRRRETQVVCVCGLFIEGTDIPEIECIQILRPTKSLGRWIQILGRGARPNEGKKSFKVLDHGGCILEPSNLGFYEQDREWTLEGRKLKFKEQKARLSKPFRCKVCNHVFNPAPRCPLCGTDCNLGMGRKVETTDDELVSIGKNKKRKETVGELKRWFGMFLYHAKYGKKYEKAFGWAVHKWKDKFKIDFEPIYKSGPIPPDEAFLNYLVHLRIKYAHWKKKKDAEAAA